MERIAYIETYAKDKGYGDNSILYALIRCLPARDALALLRRCYKDNPVLRDATLYVLNDLKGPGCEEELEQLAEAIIQEFPALPANRRSSAFLCLGVLFNKVSDVTADRIMKFLLDSRYAAGRRKGLKLLRSEEVTRYGVYVERCAWEHREHVAVMLRITHYPAQYVHDRRQDFARILDAQWSLARLYLRAAEHDRSCVADSSLLPAAIDECLRYDSPVTLFPRTALADTTIRDTPIDAGEPVFVSISAANRDPARFANPDQFDIDRRDNEHLAFGGGIHYCLGAGLARTEAQIIFSTLLRRYPHLALAGENIEWRATFSFRGPAALHVSLGKC